MFLPHFGLQGVDAAHCFGHCDSVAQTHTSSLSLVLLQGSEIQQTPEQIVLVPLHRHYGLSGPPPLPRPHPRFFSSHAECGEGSSARLLLLAVKILQKKETKRWRPADHFPSPPLTARSSCCSFLYVWIYLYKAYSGLLMSGICLESLYMLYAGKEHFSILPWLASLRRFLIAAPLTRQTDRQTGGDWRLLRDGFLNEQCRPDLRGTTLWYLNSDNLTPHWFYFWTTVCVAI